MAVGLKGAITTITRLVFDFFQLCNLKPIQIRTGLWQVHIDEALMKEMDGWRARARLLQFTFDKNLAETYGAELISPGSYRLNTILQVIRKQGILSQAHLPHQLFHEPNIRRKVLGSIGIGSKAYVVNSSLFFNQYLLLHLLVSQEGLEKKESIHKPIVNLSSGEVLKFPLPLHLLKEGGVEQNIVRKRRCSFKKAFQEAIAHLEKEMASGDQSWAFEAQEHFEKEEEKLKKFFDDQTTDEFQAKQRELKNRLAPKIKIQVLRGAILYIPIFHYRLIVVDTNGQEKTQVIYYDPVSNLHEQESLNANS